MAEKVSIIIPIFNGARFIKRLIENLSAISYQNIEIIFVDNNSTDNSVTELERECHKLRNFEFNILHENSPGAAHARNYGVKACTGDYVTFIDCDDYFEPQKIAIELEILLNKKVDFVFSRGFKQYEDGGTLLHPINEFNIGINNPPNLGLLWIKNFFLLQGISIILKKTTFFEVGGFPAIKTGEDAIFLIKLGLTKQAYFNNQVLYTYVRHLDSTVSLAQKKGNRKVDYLEQRLLMWNCPHINNISEACNLLRILINIDVLQLSGSHQNKITNLLDRHNFKPDSIINNKYSMYFQIRFGVFKNPFYWFYKIFN